MRWRPEELVLLAFLLALAVIMAVTGQAPATFTPPAWRIAWRLNVYFVAFVGLLIVLAGRRARQSGGRERLRRAGAILRDFAPFYAVVVLYQALAELTPVLRPDVADAALVRIDRAILGVDAAVWMGRFATPWLSNVMAACYGAYFILPPSLAVALHASGNRRLFRDFMVAGVLTAVLGFLGYLLVPAVGPYVFQAKLFATRLPGGAYSPAFIAAIDDLRGVARDCFPSLHTAHTAVVLVFAYRFRPPVFLACLPVAVGLFVSTIYLRVHYVIDVAAGFATAAVAVALAPRMNARCGHGADVASTSAHGAAAPAAEQA